MACLIYRKHPVIQTLKQLYTKPSAMEIALVELEEAKRQHLAHLSAAEYHIALANCYDDRVDRLKQYIGVKPAPVKRNPIDH